VTSSPGWTGILWAVGCSKVGSAEAHFARKGERAKAEKMDGHSAFLLIDREERKVLRSQGTRDPAKTARYFGDEV
jgi:hypothetical protein